MSDKTRQRLNVVWLFWLAVPALVVLYLWLYLNVLVSRSYHPMSTRGSFAMAYFEWFAAALLGIALLVPLWLRVRAPTRRWRVYLFGLLGFVGVIGLHSTTVSLDTGYHQLDTGYHQTYFLGDQRHEIPWRYAPRGGSPQPGGTYFVVDVTAEGLKPRYADARAENLYLTKATNFDFGKTSQAPEGQCQVDRFGGFSCEQRRGAFVYRVSGQPDPVPQDPEALMDQVQQILDSFAVGR